MAQDESFANGWQVYGKTGFGKRSGGKTDAVERDEITELRQKLDDAIHSPPVEEAQIRSIAMQLAALRLNAIGMEEYETIHLQSLFRGRNLMTTLDQELLHESVRQVTYIDGVVSVLLKNKQLLKGGPVR